jgi:signal transduction histidine kinase/ligand-binding sensor domain-containing protein
MRRVSVFLLLAAAFFNPSHADAQRYPFVHYTQKDGLVSTRARQVYQDSKGRLYIATFGGLSIYDGARFTNYTTDNGLAANLVNDVVEMGEDSIWVLLNINKVQCFVKGRLKDVKLDGFCPVINKLIKSNDGFYYALADEGLFRLQRNRFVKLEVKDENGVNLNKYFATGCIADNKIFISTDPTIGFYPSPSYLVVYDLETRKVCISKKPPEVYSIAASPNNEILVATNEGLKNLDKPALQQGRIAFSELPERYQSAKRGAATSLYFDREQNLWLTTREGIVKIDRHGRSKLYSTDNGLPVDLHYSVFQDREHIMWFANEQTGISKLSNTQVEFYTELKPGFTASDLYADNSSDSVWFYDEKHKKLLLHHPDGSKEFNVQTNLNWLFRIVPGNKVNYLSGYFEVYGYDSKAGGNIRPSLIYSYRDSLSGVPMINYPTRDAHGNFLYSNNNINAVVAGNKLVSYPLGYYADQFVISAHNHLWITNRQDKLFLFKTHPEDPAHYFELLKEYKQQIPAGPRSITLDKNGNVWIGTRDQGLFCFAVDEKLNLALVQHVSTRNGLSDNCILNLHGDDEGNVWACSPVGLDKLQQKNGQWVVENITRGNNIYQNVQKAHTTRSGEHWILANSGIIRISPAAAVKHERLQANILFGEIKAGRDTLDATAGNPGLSYKKNDVSFQWAVPTFTDEKQTLFSYRLQGSATDEWSQPSGEASVRFVNLSPGKYVLHVKAIFPNGLYPETNAQYAFQILAPWWQTWWFKALISLAAGGMIVLLVRGYFKRKLARQRILLEKRQAIEKERSRIASDMHDDLGAGLSTIRFLSEKVRRNPVSDVTKNEIEKIAGISVELVENMNEIIWAMNEENDTLEDLLFYTRSYAKEYCEEHQLHCVVDFPEHIPAAFVSGELRRNVFLTVKESLHNIVKYARASQVEIAIRVGDKLTVIIKDNGVGFSTHASNTGGNGLRNMRRRIESIGGQFEILNGQGVTVKLAVPVER